MNFKRALGIALVIFFALWVVVVIESRVFGVHLESKDPATIPAAIWYISIISAGIVSAAGAHWYFRSPKTIPGVKNGLLFGLFLSVLGFIGDIILFIPHQDGIGVFMKYFLEPQFWSAFVLILIATTLVGYNDGKNRR